MVGRIFLSEKYNIKRLRIERMGEPSPGLKGPGNQVTGTGRSYALGYNLALRYLEAGDTVIATIRKPSADIVSFDIQEIRDLFFGYPAVRSFSIFSIRSAEINSISSEACWRVSPASSRLF